MKRVILLSLMLVLLLTGCGGSPITEEQATEKMIQELDKQVDNGDILGYEFEYLEDSRDTGKDYDRHHFKVTTEMPGYPTARKAHQEINTSKSRYEEVKIMWTAFVKKDGKWVYNGVLGSSSDRITPLETPSAYEMSFILEEDYLNAQYNNGEFVSTGENTGYIEYDVVLNDILIKESGKIRYHFEFNGGRPHWFETDKEIVGKWDADYSGLVKNKNFKYTNDNGVTTYMKARFNEETKELYLEMVQNRHAIVWSDEGITWSGKLSEDNNRLFIDNKGQTNVTISVYGSVLQLGSVKFERYK
ncbi:MAG: hypothetical protein WDA24_02185 [Tissierellales bacterium]